jgi:glycerophosphoryl diester phosphodiesterase
VAAAALSAFAIAPAAATASPVSDVYAQHGPDAPVLVAAHRADWRSAPENSLAAIEAAVRQGAEVIEIDVKRTSDGVLVLMHDDSVDRTTSGRGNVSTLTSAQVQDLRLREGLGGADTAVTEHGVPTLEEAMRVTKGRAMVNLDKGWAYRDAMLDVLVRTDTVEEGIFKSTAPVPEVQAFRAKDPRIVYSHVVEDANASSVDAFGDDQPESYELIFDRLTDAQIQPAVVDAIAKRSRIWINTMWKGLAANYTDEASLIDPARGWSTVTDRFHADVIQTDNIPQLRRHLAGEDVTRVADARRSFRVQAEDYSRLGKGVGYHDTDDANNGGAARPFEGVDLCDQQGAIVACYTRATEWLRFDIDVPTAGTYRVSGRIAVNKPTGRIRMDYGGGVLADAVVVRNTTSHDAFGMQTLDATRTLAAGPQSVWLRLDGDGIQNFNLDYLQFDRTSADEPAAETPQPPVEATPQPPVDTTPRAPEDAVPGPLPAPAGRVPAPVSAGPARDVLAPFPSRITAGRRGITVHASEASTITATVRRRDRTVRGVGARRSVRTTYRHVVTLRGRANGAGTVRLARALPSGTYRITFTARDAAGNVSRPRVVLRRF